MSAADEGPADVFCAYTIDNLRNDRPRGRDNRPWWRRSCKRKPKVGSRYCWQHARIMGEEG